MTQQSNLVARLGVFLRFTGKWLLAASILSLGLASGIYYGNRWVRGSTSLAGVEITNYALLDSGERFPNMTLTNLKDGNTFELSDIASQRSIVLVFVAQECGFCHLLLSYWDKKVLPKLSPNITPILVFDIDDTPLEDIESYDISHSHQFIIAATDRSHQRKEDGIASTPTIVGLKPGMEIDFIQSGFNRGVTGEFLNSRL